MDANWLNVSVLLTATNLSVQRAFSRYSNAFEMTNNKQLGDSFPGTYETFQAYGL